MGGFYFGDFGMENVDFFFCGVFVVVVEIVGI